MKLPNGNNAYISSSKLEGYLLSESHQAGHSKAKFFRAWGFNEATLGDLRDNLLRIARENDIIDTVTSPHGIKYVLDGWLATPSKHDVFIRTIWIIDVGYQNPRFVTAYPG